MLQEILFVHSAGNQGRDEGSHRLVEYLKEHLGKKYDLIVPLMPDPENPRFEAWASKIDSIMEGLNGRVFLIGHSLGGSVLLKYLSELQTPKEIGAMFLISTPYWGNKDWQIAEFMLKKDFVQSLPAVHKVFIYHSYEDEWVPFQHSLVYAQQFPQATVRMLEGDAHEFFDGLPQLVKDIKNL